MHSARHHLARFVAEFAVARGQVGDGRAARVHPDDGDQGVADPPRADGRRSRCPPCGGGGAGCGQRDVERGRGEIGVVAAHPRPRERQIRHDSTEHRRPAADPHQTCGDDRGHAECGCTPDAAGHHPDDESERQHRLDHDECGQCHPTPVPLHGCDPLDHRCRLPRAVHRECAQAVEPHTSGACLSARLLPRGRGYAAGDHNPLAAGEGPTPRPGCGQGEPWHVS